MALQNFTRVAPKPSQIKPRPPRGEWNEKKSAVSPCWVQRFTSLTASDRGAEQLLQPRVKSDLKRDILARRAGAARSGRTCERRSRRRMVEVEDLVSAARGGGAREGLPVRARRQSEQAELETSL